MSRKRPNIFKTAQTMNIPQEQQSKFNYSVFYFHNKEKGRILVEQFAQAFLKFSNEFESMRNWYTRRRSTEELTINQLYAGKNQSLLYKSYAQLFEFLIEIYELKLSECKQVDPERQANKCFSNLQRELKLAIHKLPIESAMIYSELIVGLGIYYFLLKGKEFNKSLHNAPSNTDSFFDTNLFTYSIKSSWKALEHPIVRSMECLITTFEFQLRAQQGYTGLQDKNRFHECYKEKKTIHHGVNRDKQLCFKEISTKITYGVTYDIQLLFAQIKTYNLHVQTNPELLEDMHQYAVIHKKTIETMTHPDHKTFCDQHFQNRLEGEKKYYAYYIHSRKSESINPSNLLTFSLFRDNSQQLKKTYLETKYRKEINRNRALELGIPDNKHIEFYEYMGTYNISTLLPSITPSHTAFLPIKYFSQKADMNSVHDFFTYEVLRIVEDMIPEFEKYISELDTTKKIVHEKIISLSSINEKCKKIAEICRSNSIKFEANEIISVMRQFSVKKKQIHGDHVKLVPKKNKQKAKNMLPEIDTGRKDNFYISHVEGMCQSLDISFEHFLGIYKGDDTPFALTSEEKKFLKKEYEDSPLQ